MERPFPAYKGNEPYVFVSYAHDDDGVVYPEIQWLKSQGFNIWYDEGISPGSEWHTELAESIENSSLFLYFITPRSVKSDHCQREVHYAIDHKKPLLAVYLEASELPSGLRFSIGTVQAIMRHELTYQDYRSKLLKGTSDHIQRGIAPGSESRSPMVAKTRLIVMLGLAVLVLGGIVAVILLDSGFNPVAVDKIDQPTTAIRSNWIAVLPFRTVSAANEDESLLAEAITGDLISALSRLDMFTVASYGAVRAFGESPLSPQQTATELGVRYLIEGRVQVLAGHTRIGISVVDGVEGKTMLEASKSYQGRNLLETQDDFTRFASRAVDIELLRFESQRVRKLTSEDMAAWEHFVLAMDAWEDPTPATFVLAIREHRSALELEPNYVLSLGQLATVININILMGESLDRAAARLEACQLADRAIALGEDSPFALYSGVNVLSVICGEAEKAVQISRRMVLAHPNSGYNQTIMGYALHYAGESAEAMRVFENAEKDFPDNIYVFRYTPYFKSMIYTERQQWGKALKISRESLNINPSSVFDMFQLANALGALDRPDEAMAVWVQLLARFPNFTIENYEWYLKQGLITDERVEPFVKGLKRARLEEQKK